MRFVDLRRENGKTPFDTVINTGCGPNFVLNRKKHFFFMIKKQSVIFWFRFWLTFCLNPGCYYLDKARREIPDLMLCFCKYTHDILLQGSDEQVCQKCFDLLEHMLPTLLSNNPIYRKKSVESVIKDQMSGCLAMAFGCALCEVFYKWLNSKREDEAGFHFYWQLPEMYLNPNFLPGELEAFIVKKWRNNFITFLNVRPDQVPWVENLLVPPEEKVVTAESVDSFHLPLIPESNINLWLRNSREVKKDHRKIDMYRWQYSVKLREYSKTIKASLWLKRMAILKVDEKRFSVIELETQLKEKKSNIIKQQIAEKLFKNLKRRNYKPDLSKKSTNGSTDSKCTIGLEKCSYCSILNKIRKH